MGCIDKELSPEEVEDRIAGFILRDFEGMEFYSFIEHMIDCEYCDTMVMSGLKAKRVFKQQVTYEKLCAAYDNKDWERVIELGREMEALGYSEEIHPIKEMLQNSKSNLDLQYTKFDELEKAFQNKEWEKVINIALEMEDLNYDEEEHPIKKKYNLALRYYIYETNKQIEKGMNLLISEASSLENDEKLSQSEIHETINKVMKSVKNINKDMPFPEIMSSITEGLKIIYKAKASITTEAGVKFIDDFTQFQTLLSKVGVERVEEIIDTLYKEEGYSKSISKYDEWKLKDD